MKHKSLLKSLSLVAATLIIIGNANAYHCKIHALSAKLAAELVKRMDTHKRYAEIYDLSIILQLGTGAWEEDIGNSAGNNRAMRHYYDPDCPEKKKGVPYYPHYWWWSVFIPGTEVTKPDGKRYPGALEWARNGAVNSWNNANPFNWEGAILAYDYTQSSRTEAYYRLGHVIHLLTDMAEPDHALTVPHPGSSYGIPDDLDIYISGKFYDALMEDLKPMELSIVKKIKLSWLVYVSGLRQLALRNRNLGYERLIDDCIHPKFVNEFFKGHHKEHLVMSETTWDVLPPIQGKEIPALHRFDDFFNSMARHSKQAVSDRNVYRIPLGVNLLKKHFPHVEMIYQGEPIYLIPAIDMKNDSEKQKYYKLAWGLLEKATEYNAKLLMHFHDIVNPPPYVKEVRVSQEGDLKYRGYWKDIFGTPEGKQNSKDPHRNYTIVTKREFKDPVKKGIMHDKKATIVIEFGPDTGIPENIDKGSVKVMVGGKAAPGSIRSDKERNIWGGSFDVPKLGENEDMNILQISISASDADMHWTYGPIPGSTLDSDPYSAAKVYYDGPDRYRWMNHESATADEKWDRHHKIKIVKKEEAPPFEFYFTSVTQGTGPPYTDDVAYHTSLSTSTDVWVQLFEKESWCINRDKPRDSWYTKLVQKDGFYEIHYGKPTSLQTPSQNQLTDYAKNDGVSDDLTLFNQDENENFVNRYTGMRDNRITARGPYGALYDKEDESKVYKWIYRGRGKDGKVYEVELVFDFKNEWTVDHKTHNQIVYKRVKEKD